MPSKIEEILPFREREASIPRIIHQMYATVDLPKPFAESAEGIKAANPGWEHRLYDDEAMMAYVADRLPPELQDIFHRIDPEYRVAQSDIFRYLLMYYEGGFYIDIKSRPARPLDELLPANFGLVTAQWGNEPGRAYGRHRQLRSVAGGEYQQWHITCAPGHPALRAVIVSVFNNIQAYSPWTVGVGKKGVLLLTGPIAYTLAIANSPDKADVYVAESHEKFGMEYSVVADHRVFFRKHYSTLKTSIVTPSSGLGRLNARVAWWSRHVATVAYQKLLVKKKS